MAVVLGLAVAATYGAADFFGGLGSKRATSWSVVLGAQCVGVGVVAFLVAIDGGSPRAADLAFGAAASCVGVVGVGLLYRGLARGPMVVVAPVTAIGSAIVPVGYGLATGERPGAVALIGVAVSLAAVALIARERRDSGSGTRIARSTLVAAVVAGSAFGAVFILLDQTRAASGFWPLLSGRVASVALLTAVLAARGDPMVPRPAGAPLVVAAGVFDVAANALFLLAVREGLLSLVSVLGSLYPVATVLLARVVLDERLLLHQLVGLGLALGGVAMIAS